MTRLLLLALGFAGVSASIVACGGSPSGSSSNTNDDPSGWGTNTQVEAVLAANCSGCHSSQWDSCWNVQASAQEIESLVSSGAMPRGGSMSSSDKSTLLNWLSAGASCSGTKPSGGGSSSGGGGPPTGPIIAG
jgi:hypothetical protein